MTAPFHWLSAVPLLLALVVTGCREPSRAEPVLHAFKPASGLDDREVRIVVEGAGFQVAATTDFQSGAQSTIDPRFQLLLGDVRLDDVVWIDGTRLEATVPAGLLPGKYAASLIDPVGKVARLGDAYEVVAVEQADLIVAAFSFEPITTQRASQPFNVRVRAVDAQGQRVAGFNGEVTLTASTGAVVPRLLGAFNGGEWSGQVELTAAAAANVLSVVDDKGRSGQSAPFAVVAPAAVGLSLTGLSASLTAGTCEGPLSVTLVAAFGANVTSSSPVQVALSADDPRALSFFADSGCTTQISSLAVSSTATVFVRGTRPLQLDVSAVSPPLRAAVVRTQVRAGPPTSVVFLTAARTLAANTCSPATELGLEDAAGNPLTMTSPVTLTLDVLPATGLQLFSDSGCSAGTTTATLAVGADRAVVFFRAALAGTYRLTANLGAANAVQDELIVPGNSTVARSPPRARLSGSGGALTGTPTTFDASASTDLQTPASALQVSFDFSGTAISAPGTAPWTTWTTVKTATTTYTSAGSRLPRVAVRDADGDISIASLFVRTTLASSACVVTSAGPDDGATSCTGARGPDGVLSFLEAVRLVNATTGSFEIVMSAPLTVTGGTYTFGRSGYLLSAQGVVFDGATLIVNASATVRSSSIELTGAAGEIRVEGSGELTLEDAYLHDFSGITYTGRRLELFRSRVSGCAAAFCIAATSAALFLNVEHSVFTGLPGKGLLNLTTDPGVTNSNTKIAFYTSVVTGYGTAVVLGGGNTQGTNLYNNTFDSNATALQIVSANKLGLRNNVFTRHSATAVTGCANATFDTRDTHLFFQNLADGCLAGDPGTLIANPLYVDVLAGDYALQLTSPAVDTGAAMLIDLNGGAPGTFTGAAADRGGVETW